MISFIFAAGLSVEVFPESHAFMSMSHDRWAESWCSRGAGVSLWPSAFVGDLVVRRALTSVRSHKLKELFPLKTIHVSPAHEPQRYTIDNVGLI